MYAIGWVSLMGGLRENAAMGSRCPSIWQSCGMLNGPHARQFGRQAALPTGWFTFQLSSLHFDFRICLSIHCSADFCRFCACRSSLSHTAFALKELEKSQRPKPSNSCEFKSESSYTVLQNTKRTWWSQESFLSFHNRDPSDCKATNQTCRL
jgi:hypothetical protein